MAAWARRAWASVLGFCGLLLSRLARVLGAVLARLRPETTRADGPGLGRRTLVSVLGVSVAGIGAFFGAIPRALGRRAERRRHRWGMVIDLDRCSGCGACTVACRQENNVPFLGPAEENRGAHIEWMTLLWLEPEEEGGQHQVVPFPCQHCEDAPCTKVCPVGATYESPEGLTAQIWDRCIGCRYCMAACPYARRSFNWKTPRWDGDLVQLLNPDVATRPTGVVEKCTFCHQRIQAVKEKAALERRSPTDEELRRLPACATACPARAITFGDRADSNSTVSRLARSVRAFRLLSHLGTRPRVIYLKRDVREG